MQSTTSCGGQFKFKPYISCFQDHLHRYTKNCDLVISVCFFSTDYTYILVLFLHLFLFMGLLPHLYCLPKCHLLEVFGYIYLFAFLFICFFKFGCCVYVCVHIRGQRGGVVSLIPPCGSWNGTQCLQLSHLAKPGIYLLDYIPQAFCVVTTSMNSKQNVYV